PRVRHRQAADRTSVATGDAENVGQVQLALGVVGGQAGETVGEHRGVEGVDTRVDLGDGPLGLVGVLVLDDAGDGAPGVAHDAAVTGRVVDHRGEHRDGVALAL